MGSLAGPACKKPFETEIFATLVSCTNHMATTTSTPRVCENPGMNGSVANQIAAPSGVIAKSSQGLGQSRSL